MSDPAHRLARDGAILGDYTFDQIQEGLAGGTLLPTDHVWAPGKGRWILLRELEALAKPARPTVPAPSPTAVVTGGFWSTLGRGTMAALRGAGWLVGGAFKALGTVMSWIFVIGIGLFIGMLIEGRGNPRRNPATDPLHDPYAGRRDPDFDDRDRDV